MGAPRRLTAPKASLQPRGFFSSLSRPLTPAGGQYRVQFSIRLDKRLKPHTVEPAGIGQNPNLGGADGHLLLAPDSVSHPERLPIGLLAQHRQRTRLIMLNL